MENRPSYTPNEILEDIFTKLSLPLHKNSPNHVADDPKIAQCDRV